MNSPKFSKDCLTKKGDSEGWLSVLEDSVTGVLWLETEKVVPAPAQSQGCGAELQQG